MTLSRDHQLLIVLAEELHFGRAAERLQSAQPHVSARLKAIEQSLGFVLFQRRPNVALTAAGAVFLKAVRRASAELQASAERAFAISAGEVGSVSVGCASTVLATDIPEALQAFRAAHPEVNLRLREMHSSDHAAALDSGLIDVALTRQPMPAARFRSVRLLEEPFVAALPEAHSCAGRPSLHVEDLAAEPFVLFRRELAPILHDQITALCAVSGFSPSIVQEADEWHTVLGLVRSGFGVSLAPAGLQALRWRGLAYRPLVGQAVVASIFVCWDVERASVAAKTFVRFLAKEKPPGEAKRTPPTPP
jgi:DNA-binding transcriptional LysR family regulator